MASVVGLTVVKRFTYRGSTMEEYSNTYHLSGSIPSDATAWRTLFDAMCTAEKTIYPASVSIVKGYGYDSDADDATAVWSVDLTVSPNTPVAGTLSTSGMVGLAPGDVAMWARWKTSRLNTKGKPIYLRKYFHPVAISSVGPDNILGGQQGAVNTFAGKLHDGTFLDGRTIRSRLHPDTILSHGYSTYSTTRTLKRRGKRPGS